MSTQITCSVCSKHFAVPDAARGRRIKCPACGSAIDVPNVVLDDDDPFDDIRWKEPPRPAAPVVAPPIDPNSTQLEVFGGGGGSTLPPVRVKTPRTKVRVEGGLIDFIGDHKLVLAVFAFAAAFFWLGARFGITLAGMVLAFFGIVVAAGAWRSQKLFDRRDKEAEDWRRLEAIAGNIVLVALGGYTTWFLGRRLYALFEFGQQVGFQQKLVSYMAGTAVAWLLIVGYFVFLHHMSRHHGFFKPAGWTYIGYFCLLWIILEVRFGDQFGENRQGRQIARQVEMRPPPRINRPGFGNRPIDPIGRRNTEAPKRPFSRFDLPQQAKQQPKLLPTDIPTLKMGRLNGIPMPDELSAAADASARMPAEVRLGEGFDSQVAERRPAVKWMATADPQISNLKFPTSDSKPENTTAVGKRLAQVPLTDGSQVIVPRGAGPWLAVSSGGRETANSLKLYNLLTHAEREIKGKIALGSPRALSPDGKYFAAFNKQEKAVDVWSFEKGKSVARLQIAPLEEPSVIEFASGDRLVVAGDIGHRFDGSPHCKIWSLPNDTAPRSIALPKAVKFGDWLATVSPGGKYLAAFDKGGIWMIDLDRGRLCGKAMIDESDRSEKFHMRPAGLSFSSDGEVLACFVNRFRGSRLLAWKMSDGTVAADHLLEAEFDRLHRGEENKSLDCFPDGNGWLVDGRAIIEPKSGEPGWLDLSYKDGIFDRKLTVYGLADRDRLIVGSPKMITTWSIPRGLDDEIEMKSLVVSADDLPSGMLPEPEMRRFGIDDDEEEQTISGDELELASRKYRQAAQLKVLAANDDKLSSMFGWYPATQRPTFGLRVGIAAQAPDGSKDLIPLASTKSLAEFTGKVGPKVVSEIRKRFAQDAFGDWPQTEDSSARGIVFVGIGPREKVLPAAKRAELDVVIMLEVWQQQIGNTKRFDMQLRARVADASGEPVWVSPMLSSEKSVAAERDNQDLVTPFVEELCGKIDELYTLKPMPEAKADAAKERVRAIVNGDVLEADRLTAAAELRYYQIAGVLSAEEALPAYRKLFDDETAEALAGGDARMRRAALEKWAGENSL